MILITGASSGIGEACATLFASQQHDLFLLARNTEKLTQLKNTICTQFKVDIEIASVDITDQNALIHLFQTHQHFMSRIDCLINNAGLAKGLAPTHELEFDAINAMIDTNLRGLITMSKLMIPFFLKNANGHIINVGSIAGHHVYPYGNIYCATKSAVHAMTEALRYDLLGKGIRVSEISPGMVNTNFSTIRLGDRQKAEQVYAGMQPLTARDVAEGIWWMYQRPKHVNIQEIVIYPTDQVSPFQVHRRQHNSDTKNS